MSATLQTIQQQLTVAREQALLGDYDSAIVYYKSVIAQVQGCARCLRPALARVPRAHVRIGV